MKQLLLDDLGSAYAQLPSASGIHLAHAAAICLHDRGHRTGVHLRVHGEVEDTLEVHWRFPITRAMESFWNDMQVATGQGAYGISLVLLHEVRNWQVVERSRKKSGFDWWLGTADNYFQQKIRLEVSGILRGDIARIKSSATEKRRRLRRYPMVVSPAIVAVVEFGTPLVWIERP